MEAIDHLLSICRDAGQADRLLRHLQTKVPTGEFVRRGRRVFTRPLTKTPAEKGSHAVTFVAGTYQEMAAFFAADTKAT